MRTRFVEYRCDDIDCSALALVPEADMFAPDGWLFVEAWVVNQVGNKGEPQHFCPDCKASRLRALGR